MSKIGQKVVELMEQGYTMDEIAEYQGASSNREARGIILQRT